jgi:hypothetical protein
MPKTYSLNFLSSEFSIDRQTAVRATKGIAPTEEKTKGRPTYSIAAFARALESHRAANASNNDSYSLDGADASPLMEARIRITTANAVARERENAIAAGELVSIADVVAGFTASLSVFHQILLTGGVRIANDLMPHTPLDHSAIVDVVNLVNYNLIDELRKPLTSMTAEYVASAVAAMPKELSLVATTAHSRRAQELRDTYEQGPIRDENELTRKRT